MSGAAPGESPDSVEPGKAAKALLRHGRDVRRSAEKTLANVEEHRVQARRLYEEVRDEIVAREIASMPITRLNETTQGRLRLGTLERAGYRTVGAAEAAGAHRLQQVHGVGPQTANQVIAAARQLEGAMREGIRVRFHPETRSRTETDLLRALRAYGSASSEVRPIKAELEDATDRLPELLEAAKPAKGRIRWLFTSATRKEAARGALASLHVFITSPDTADFEAKLELAVEASKTRVDRSDPWPDFEAHAVTYNGLLIDVGGIASDAQAVQGFIPAEIAVRVQEQPLDTSFLEASLSLRGYQAFGARFALVQRKAILGDEMGLGKTIEALAAIAHLHAEGEQHFLVVCPASVLVNWAHEVERHSQLSAHRIHGSDRNRNRETWIRGGGVAITTYDSLKAIRLDDVRIAMVVVDEAHYVKNPSAQRTKEVRRRVGLVDRALFLTGTPMENRIDEFRTLVSHLHPEIARRISKNPGLAGANAFRKAVAPVYLRRNQDDVLQELPPLIETEDWVRLESEDWIAYRQAVASGNFMAMRRAAYMPESVAGSSRAIVKCCGRGLTRRRPPRLPRPSFLVADRR